MGENVVVYLSMKYIHEAREGDGEGSVIIQAFSLVN